MMLGLVFLSKQFCCADRNEVVQVSDSDAHIRIEIKGNNALNVHVH